MNATGEGLRTYRDRTREIAILDAVFGDRTLFRV